MKNKLMKVMIGLSILMLILQRCTTMDTSDVREMTDKTQHVATTTLSADLNEQIGDELYRSGNFDGPGIDPHVYQATARDDTRIFNTQIVKLMFILTYKM